MIRRCSHCSHCSRPAPRLNARELRERAQARANYLCAFAILLASAGLVACYVIAVVYSP